MASLIYGAGLRLLECAELRVKDINFDRDELTIRDGKGGKDRVTMLPAALRKPLLDHLARVKVQHGSDLVAGRGTVALPRALREKYPNAPSEWGWQWVFPATRFTLTGRPGCAADIIYTNPFSNARSRMQSVPLAYRVLPRAIHCVIHSQPIYWKAVTTSERYKNCSGIATSVRR